MMKKLLLLLSLIYPLLLVAQHTTEVAPLKGERWLPQARKCLLPPIHGFTT